MVGADKLVAGNCKRCSAPFLKRSDAEFCTPKCYRKWRDDQIRPKKFCKICNTQLPKTSTGAYPKCCGDECRLQLIHNEREIKNCKQCGDSLLGKEVGAKEFCTLQCYGKFPKSDEMRKKTADVQRGRKQRPETIAKRAKSNTGKKHSAESIARAVASKAWYYEQGPTEETRLKLREAKARNPMVGEKHWNWNPNREEQRLKEVRAKSCHSFIGRMLGWKFAGYVGMDVDRFELGYSGEQLAEHIEKQFIDGMNWHNYGTKGWHVDHIRPVSSFPVGTPLNEINALTNLRPLWWRDNLSKGGKWLENLLETETNIP